jgi:glycosyltransferase involved in cell wall biosynthesis
MSRVLFLAYHFPPLGGPGTQRSIKFASNLPGLGYLPLVITGPGVSREHWEPRDDTLLAELPAEVEVVRARGPAPQAAPGRRERWLDRATPFARWWVSAAVAAGRLRAAECDVIYASMAPYETAVAAARLGQESGLPWIADLRDPWALDEMRVYPSAVHRERDLARMRDVLGSAHAIVMNTPAAVDALRTAFPELSLKPVVCIPNGYDARDFAGPPPASGRSGRLRIVHTGSLHTELGARHAGSRVARRLLGGSEDIDILARSHVHLLRALDSPALAGRVELHLAGALTAADRRANAGAAVPIHEHGYLEHADSVALLRSADLLFLPMHDLPAGVRARIVPGKTYEYLAAGRPILGAMPAGDARELLATSPVARLCAPTDADAMAAHVAAELEQVSRHGRRPDAWPEGIERYERGALAAEIAELFDRFVTRGARRATRAPTLRLVG